MSKRPQIRRLTGENSSKMEDEENLDRNIFNDEVVALESKIAEWPDYKQLVVFYGSSSFRLWSTIREDLAPLNVMNLGFGGASFGWTVFYYDRLIKSLPTASHFVFYCGDNDLDNGITPEGVMKRFRKLVDMTRRDFPKAKISVVTIKPSPSRTYLQDKIKLTNSLIRKDLSGVPRASQINVYDSMLDEKGVARPELFIEDELHMNQDGYKIWKGEIRKFFGI
ncbi:MAG: GDSL-type esterase/lipase family protein [Cyclobacteriaceae bacterium]